MSAAAELWLREEEILHLEGGGFRVVGGKKYFHPVAGGVEQDFLESGNLAQALIGRGRIRGQAGKFFPECYGGGFVIEAQENKGHGSHSPKR